MAQQPLISVVITCYNLAGYIGAAIESVFAQIDPGPFEVLVVDDCSTDESATVISQYPAVRTICTKGNGGVMLAMITGIQAAKGDLIALLDGDDVWEPGKLAAVRRAFAEPRVGFVTHDLIYADAQCRPEIRQTRPDEVLTRAPVAAHDGLLRQGILSLADYIWLGSAMSLRKSLIDWDAFVDWIATLPDSRNVYQDWPLAYWIALRPDIKLGYVAAKLFRYRLHGANHSGDASTVERAVRNYRRAFLTLSAIAQLAQEDGSVPPSTLRFVRARTSHTAARLAAHSPSERLASVCHFLRSVPDLRARGLLLRETAILACLILLGPERTRRLASLRRP